MNKRIIIAYSNLDIGGIPTKIIDIVNEVGRFHPDVTVDVLLQKGGPHDLRSLIRNKRAVVCVVPYPFATGRSVAYIIWLWWWVITHNPFAILAFISPYALPALLAKKLFFWRKLRVILSEDHYTQTMLSRMAAPWLQRIGIRMLYPSADAIIVPTHAIKRQLGRLCRLPYNKTIVVPNWTRYVDRPLQHTKRIWDIIHIGRLAPSKNPMRIIHIMERYISRHPKACCAIVGDGPERKNVENYIQRYHLTNHIRLYPATYDVYPYLSKAKTFIFLPEPKTEGFPIALLEAMACGAIVITTPFDGIRETITNYKTGIISSYQSVLKDIDVFSSVKKNYTIRRNAYQYVLTACSKSNVVGYIQSLPLY